MRYFGEAGRSSVSSVRLRLARHQGEPVEAAKIQSFDEAKGASKDLKQQKRSENSRRADQFQNRVRTGGFAAACREGAQSSGPNVASLTRPQVQALGQANPKFAQAVFSPESLQSKRNTEAIEVGPNMLAAARVVDYKAATPRPFDDVKSQIKKQLELNAASDLAQAAGKEKLALLQAGNEAGVAFGKPITVTRNQVQPGFAPDSLLAIFHVDPAKLPGYVGTPSEGGGFSIYKVTQVIAAPAPDAARIAAFNGRIGEQLGREMFNAYVASLKAKADVKINQTNLEKK
jgi:peptidyl-prolyl cis-trans isomerase D